MDLLQCTQKFAMRMVLIAATIVIAGLCETVCALECLRVLHYLHAVLLCVWRCHAGAGGRRARARVTAQPCFSGRLLREGQQRRADKGPEAIRTASPELELSLGRRVLPRGVRVSVFTTASSIVLARALRRYLRVSFSYADALGLTNARAPVACVCVCVCVCMRVSLCVSLCLKFMYYTHASSLSLTCQLTLL